MTGTIVTLVVFGMWTGYLWWKMNNTNSNVDAYCPNCDDYICDERVTFEECCDVCNTPVEYH